MFSVHFFHGQFYFVYWATNQAFPLFGKLSIILYVLYLYWSLAFSLHNLIFLGSLYPKFVFLQRLCSILSFFFYKKVLFERDRICMNGGVLRNKQTSHWIVGNLVQSSFSHGTEIITWAKVRCSGTALKILIYACFELLREQLQATILFHSMGLQWNSIVLSTSNF